MTRALEPALSSLLYLEHLNQGLAHTRHPITWLADSWAPYRRAAVVRGGTYLCDTDYKQSLRSELLSYNRPLYLHSYRDACVYSDHCCFYFLMAHVLLSPSVVCSWHPQCPAGTWRLFVHREAVESYSTYSTTIQLHDGSNGLLSPKGHLTTICGILALEKYTSDFQITNLEMHF